MTASPTDDNASPEHGIHELIEELSHARGGLAEARAVSRHRRDPARDQSVVDQFYQGSRR